MGRWRCWCSRVNGEAPAAHDPLETHARRREMTERVKGIIPFRKGLGGWYRRDSRGADTNPGVAMWTPTTRKQHSRKTSRYPTDVTDEEGARQLRVRLQGLNRHACHRPQGQLLVEEVATGWLGDNS